MNVGDDIVAKSNNMDASVDKKVVLSLHVALKWARHGGAQSIKLYVVARDMEEPSR